MTSRVAQLQARRERLQDISGAERESMRQSGAQVGRTLHTLDRAIATAQRLTRSPVVIGVALVGIFVLRRHPVASWALRGVALLGTARRTIGMLERLASADSARPSPPR